MQVYQDGVLQMAQHPQKGGGIKNDKNCQHVRTMSDNTTVISYINKKGGLNSH